MIATVKADRTNEVIAGFVGEDAGDRATEFLLNAPDPDALVTQRSAGTRIEVAVHELQAGDVLVPTRACVLGSRGLRGKLYSRPSAGTRTPRGKLDVLLRHPQGRVREATWGRYTKVTIIRHTED